MSPPLSLAKSLMPSVRRRRVAPPTLPPAVIPSSPTLPTLMAERLRLRWLDRDDIDAIYAVFSDPDVMRFWSRPPFDSRDDAEIYLESIQRGFERGDLMQWGIALNGSNLVIGTATLAQVDLGQGRAEIGIALSSAHWGQGYAREALMLAIRHAFDHLGLRRLEADVDPRNLASLKALEAMGFKREGYLRQRWLVAGELQDSVLLGLLESDWSRHAMQ